MALEMLSEIKYVSPWLASAIGQDCEMRASRSAIERHWQSSSSLRARRWHSVGHNGFEHQTNFKEVE